ncbi:MAG: hypothetical protein CM15mP49_24620 [Actinomycetota bacterium]|nr:MAG: hypothetical protein CM15mP49_24620 [Actinomycetota bacterium]
MLGKGRIRDSVLQLRYVSADGKIITSGAPVVKMSVDSIYIS